LSGQGLEKGEQNSQRGKRNTIHHLSINGHVTDDYQIILHFCQSLQIQLLCWYCNSLRLPRKCKVL